MSACSMERGLYYGNYMKYYGDGELCYYTVKQKFPSAGMDRNIKVIIQKQKQKMKCTGS